MVCPKCQSEILENGPFFACENVKQEKNEETGNWEDIGSCTWKVWKSAFVKLGGEELTLEILDKIITDGEAEVSLFSQKKGKPYKGIAIPDEKYGVKIDFDRFNK